MDSESLPPIPTPAGQYWREFRIKLMPLVVFACVLAGMVLMWSHFVQPVSLVGQVETNSVNVVTTQAGLLTELALNRFDEVTNGQIIGQVIAIFLSRRGRNLAMAMVADLVPGLKMWPSRFDFRPDYLVLVLVVVLVTRWATCPSRTTTRTRTNEPKTNE